MKIICNVTHKFGKLFLFCLLLPCSFSLDAVDYHKDCFDTSCFTFLFIPETFDAAKIYCRTKYKGHLVTIRDQFKQTFIHHKLALSTASEIWIGLFAEKNSYILNWVTNETKSFSNWNDTQYIKNSFELLRGTIDRRCVKIVRDGTWFTSNCNALLPYVCEIPRTDMNVQIYSTESPGTCPEDWDNFNGFCYKDFDNFYEMKNWHEARSECQYYGGDLVSIGSYQENEFLSIVIGGRRDKYWIGLNRINITEGFHLWSDGSPVTIEFFAFNQPSNNLEYEQCVRLQIDGKTAYNSFNQAAWSDYNCNIKSRYICKIMTGLPLPPTTTANLLPGLSVVNNIMQMDVSDGLIERTAPIWNGSKYYKLTQFSNWFTARDYCQKHFSADLLTIHSKEELFWVIGFASEMRDTEAWIGLNKLNSNNFEWVDGSNASFFNWAANEPDELHAQCASIYTDSGTWRNSNCGRHLSYLCKKNFTHPISIDYGVNTFGGCPPNWTQFDVKCYRLIEEQKNWDDADKFCRDFGPNHGLVSIHNAVEQSFLITLIKPVLSDVWIGRIIAGDTNLWFWSDNSDAKYNNWNQGEPMLDSNAKEPNCSVMLRKDFSAGQWAVRNCTDKFLFICQGPPDRSLPKSEEKFPSCDIKPEFTKFASSCFKYVKQSLTFYEASENCKRQNATLASVVDSFEASFLDLYTADVKEKIWIGLTNEGENSSFKWVDNWPVFFTNWQKDFKFGSIEIENANASCVGISYAKYWEKFDCDNKFPSFCKITTEKPIRPKTEISGKCPSEKYWFDSGENCYFVSNYNSNSWYGANLECMQRHSHLASFLDSDEYQYFINKLFQYESKFWIGMYKAKDGNCVWSDKSQVSFTNWKNGNSTSQHADIAFYDMDYQNYSITECVLVDNDGKWTMKSCNGFYDFICKKAKEGVKITNPTVPSVTDLPKTKIPPSLKGNIPTENPLYSNKEISNNRSAEALQETQSGGLGGGAIFGIILGVSVAVVIILIIALIILRSPNLPNFMEGPGRFFSVLFSSKKTTDGTILNSFH